jgi:hypothetical protein
MARSLFQKPKMRPGFAGRYCGDEFEDDGDAWIVRKRRGYQIDADQRRNGIAFGAGVLRIAKYLAITLVGIIIGAVVWLIAGGLSWHPPQ